MTYSKHQRPVSSMKFWDLNKFMTIRFIRQAAVVFLFAFILVLDSIAQETEVRVIDEVVAQVNEGVITLSRVNREVRTIVDQEVGRGKTREEAERLINDKRGELIANMINEELVLQRAKEMKLDAEVEAGVNQRALQIMQEANIKTLEALYEEMRRQGVDPQEIRESWRRQVTQDLVVQQEVQRKIYWSASATELRAYFEKNKSKFTKPETISVSEMFLGFAGRDENAVRERAKQLLTQLRAGGDWDAINAANGDPGQLTRGTGKAEKLIVSELPEIIVPAVKDVKVGGFTEPIEADKLGLVILRIDAREAASSDSEYNENAVRSAIMQEKMPDAFKQFMAELRSDAYIKINEEYRPLVAPVLFAQERGQTPPGK